MMAEDELAELAADIKANGQREPVVLAFFQIRDGEKKIMLVDGRNRRAACKLAGLEPSFRFLDDDEDPTAYVISANIHRRNLTTGQRAMAFAKIYPKPEKLRRKGSSPSKTEGLAAARISEARTVLRDAGALVHGMGRPEAHGGDGARNTEACPGRS